MDVSLDFVDAGQAKEKARARPKSHRIYYLLAVFDLVSILLSVFLSHQLMQIYTDTVQVNQKWVVRLDRYSKLHQLASDLNDPGNQIFESANITKEADKLNTARDRFDHLIKAARYDLAAIESPEIRARLIRDLERIRGFSDRMLAEAESVFSYVAEKNLEEASKRMAAMDREYADLNQAFSALFEHVYEIQGIYFEQEIVSAVHLQRFEYLIGGLILLMVFGATYYGHKLSEETVKMEAEREAHLKAVAKSDERFQIVARATNDAIWDRDLLTNRMEWNRGIETLFFYDASEIRGDVEWWRKLLHPEDRERIVSGIRDVIENGETFWSGEYRFRRRDGAYAEILDRGYIVYNVAQKPVRMIGAMMDITERKTMQRDLEREMSFVQLLQWVTNAANEASTVENAMQVVVTRVCKQMDWPVGHVYLVSDNDTNALYSTDIWRIEPPEQFTAFREITKVTVIFSGTGLPGEVLKKRTPIWKRFVNEEKAYPRSEQIIASGLKGGLACPIWSGSDIVGVLEFFSTEVDDPGTPLLNVMTQIGTQLGRAVERKRAEERLHYSAHYDPLTELPNRTLFYDRLGQAIIRVRWHKKIVGVFFLDLDRFKVINDTLGHGVGDRLLQAVARRLEGCVRDGDTVSRFGGDEFALILSDIAKIDDLETLAKKVLYSISKPYRIEGHELFVSGSIGISLFPDDGREPKVLLKNADLAMYLSKDLGKNRFQFYSKALDNRSVERLSIENHLRHAIERQELFLNYQPQLSLSTRKITGVEALVRWENSELGIIPPSKFISLAEETGLIIKIGEWVLRTACRQCQTWHVAGLNAVHIAVNLSVAQVEAPGFVKMVLGVLKETGLDPTRLELEITESMLIQNKDRIKARFDELSATGIQFSIDDFGTGYSSLSYLKRFPLTRLKVDQSFIRSVTTDANDAGIAKAVVAMAHSLNLKAIAEGIETEEQLTFLESIGCDEIQGYFVSRPLSTDDATQFLITGFSDLSGFAEQETDSASVTISSEDSKKAKIH